MDNNSHNNITRNKINENNFHVKENGKKNVIVKKKVKVKNIALILIIFIALVVCFYLIVSSLLNNDEKEKKPFNNGNNSSNNVTDNNNSKNSKYKELDYINEKVSFFKEEYFDRYVAYHNANPSLDMEKVVVNVNIGLDRDFYTNIVDSPDKYTDTVLVNKYNYLDSEYVPKNLETINSKYSSGNKKMESSARVAFEAMAKDAKTEGYTIRAVSTYRSYSYQTTLYNNYAASDGKDKADTYSARAGYSEHQTGLAVDVDNAKVSYTSFGNTKEFSWMKENAYKYGFILRYTKEYEPITGYKDEPWHYRYVGVEIATYIQNHPMTYEEYYVRFLAK